MDDVNFLGFPKPNAELKVKTPDGEIKELMVNREKIANACAVFAFEFDDSDPFMHKLLVQASSQTVIICWLRFLYTGTYMPNIDSTSEPCRFLVHAELYRKAEIYDLPALECQAYQNLLQELELACCLPETSIDLCETITFLYEQLPQQKSIIENVLHYVVNCFVYHRLNEDGGFRKLFYDHDMFRKDLARMNIKRGFRDEGAAEIIQLPSDTPRTALYVIDEFLVRNDYPYELYPAMSTTAGTKTETTDESAFESKPYQKRARLAYRPRDIQHMRTLRESQAVKGDRYGSTTDESSASEADGFTLIHRPKVQSQEILTGKEAIEEPFARMQARVAELRGRETLANSSKPVEVATKIQVGFDVPKKQAKPDPSRFASDLANIMGKKRAASPFRRSGATPAGLLFAQNSGSDSHDDALASSVDTIKPGTIKIVSRQQSTLDPATAIDDSRRPFNDLPPRPSWIPFNEAFQNVDQPASIQEHTTELTVEERKKKIYEEFRNKVYKKAAELQMQKQEEAFLELSNIQKRVADSKNSDRLKSTPAPVVVTQGPTLNRKISEDPLEKVAANPKAREGKERKAQSHNVGLGALLMGLKESGQWSTAASAASATSSQASPPPSGQQATSNPSSDTELVDIDSQSDSDSWSVVDNPSA